MKALQRAPNLIEARLRLGRVLLLRGKPRDAVPELELKGQPDRIDGLAGELRNLVP